MQGNQSKSCKYRRFLTIWALILLLNSAAIFADNPPDGQNKMMTVGLITSSVSPYVEISGGPALFTFTSAAECAFGLFAGYDWIGAQSEFVHTTKSDQDSAKSSRLFGSITATNNRFYNKLSGTQIKGTYLDQLEDSSDSYYPDMEVRQISDSVLWLFNDTISLKNIYLGTEAAKQSGGSLITGASCDYISITSKKNLLADENSASLEDTYYTFNKVSYAAVSPLFGAMYNYTYQSAWNLAFGGCIGPSLVKRFDIEKNQGGGSLKIYGFGKILYTVEAGYTGGNAFISLMLDGAATPGCDVNSGYLCLFNEVKLTAKAGFRF